MKVVYLCLFALVSLPALAATTYRCESTSQSGTVEFAVQGEQIGYCTVQLDKRGPRVLVVGESGIGQQTVTGSRGTSWDVATPLRLLTIGFPAGFESLDSFKAYGGFPSPNGFGPRVPVSRSTTASFTCTATQRPLSCRPSVFKDPANQPKDMKSLLKIMKEISSDHWTPVPTITLVNHDQSDFRVFVFPESGSGTIYSWAGGSVSTTEAKVRSEMKETVNAGWEMVPVYTNSLGEQYLSKVR